MVEEHSSSCLSFSCSLFASQWPSAHASIVTHRADKVALCDGRINALAGIGAPHVLWEVERFRLKTAICAGKMGKRKREREMASVSVEPRQREEDVAKTLFKIKIVSGDVWDTVRARKKSE